MNFDKESMRYKKDAILLLSVKIAKFFFAGKVSCDVDLVARLSGNLVRNSIILLLFFEGNGRILLRICIAFQIFFTKVH